MTTVARIGATKPGHWQSAASNEPKYPEPKDPPIKNAVDKSVALMVWAVAPLLTIGLVALIAYLARN